MIEKVETGMVERVRKIVDNWDQIVDRFFEGMEASESSRIQYRRELNQFFRWLEDHPTTNGLTRLDILSYRNSMVESGKSPLTVGGYMTAVRKFFAFLEGEKLYPNIAKDIKGAKKPKGHRKDYMRKDQISGILKQIDTSSPVGKRDFALINLVARTGLRTIEVSRARVEDIRNRGEKTVLWIQGKGRDQKDDFVVLTPEALKPLEEYIQSRKAKPSDPLFTSVSNRNQTQPMTTRSISRIVKEAFKDAGIDSPLLTAHSLRHTAVSLAIQGGASLIQAQSMARHSDPKTTMIYFHDIDRVKNAAESYINF